MKIRIANNDDAEQWDQFVAEHPQASPYHRFGWKKSVEKAYRHACFYFIAEDKQEQFIGVLPTVLIKPLLLGGELTALPYCDLGEAIAIDESTKSALIEAARKLTLDHGLKSFEYRATLTLEDKSDLDNKSTSPANQKVRMLLELPDSSAMLLSGFKSKLRSQIKKAQKNGLVATLGTNDQFVEDFFNVFSCNMRDLGSPTHSKQWFYEIRNNYKKNMIISIIKYQNEPIGAGIVLFNGINAAIPWASTKRRFNHLSPNMLLYWSLLEYVTDKGCKSFDFGRSSYGEGTYKFKQQWGAKPLALSWKKFTPAIETPALNKSRHPAKIRRIVESIWRLLPLAMTIYIGPKLRKYISL